LGTYGCHAKELLNYLRSIEPKHLILNGDIIDIWQFSKRYWPKSHMQVVRHILKLVSKGVRVDYVTGNHDEMLRKFDGFELESFKICNKVLLQQNGKKVWIFHGDVFDVTMRYSKWLAKLGAVGYDTLILINRFVNWLLEKSGKEKISLSKRVKNSVKSAVKFIDDFESTAVEIAAQNEYDIVCCGHIHQPANKIVETENGKVLYLNSGDWIENLTSLEYNNGKWGIHQYENMQDEEPLDFDPDEAFKTNKELFEAMMLEFQGTMVQKSA
jgi:UDP-2,3-diacylglucosamine pyrophosphatase LpxH